MTYIKINVTANPDQFGNVRATLSGFKEKGRDLTVPFKRGSQVMLASISRNFRSGGRPTPWKPLSFKYFTRKISQGYSPIPLTRTGRLQASVTGLAETKRLRMGTSIVYGRIHQFGGLAGKKRSARIPARPYLIFQKQDLRDIERLIVEHLTGGKIGRQS